MCYLKESDKGNITNFLIKKYPNVSTAILSGSVVEGMANIDSDVDIILIVLERNQLYNETLSFRKFKLQTFVIPLQHLYERFYADYSSGRGHFIGLVAKGVYLFGHQRLAETILVHSKVLKKQGPKLISNENHLRKRIYITKCINKLGNEKEEWEDLILDAGKLVDELIGFKLESEGIWKGDGKHRMKFLEKHASLFKREIIDALCFVYKNKKYQKLIDVAKKELSTKGGMVDLYPSDNIQLTASEEYLCIHIKHLGDVKRKQNALVVLNQLFLDLRDNSHDRFKHYFYTTYLTGKGFSHNDIFCVIHAHNEWLNNFLIDRLFSLKKEYNLNNVIFPAFIGFKFKFVTEELYKNALPIFNKLSFSVLTNSDELFDESFQIFSALNILKDFTNIYFKQNVISTYDFFVFLLRSYLVYSYDNNEHVNSKELIKRRNNTIIKFEETYSFQKDILAELWLDENKSPIIDEMESFIGNLPNLSKEFERFPDFHLYLLDEIENNRFKEVLFIKEFVMRCMEILLIEASFIPYIFYSILRLEKMSFELIKEKLGLLD